jgi:alpha-beta hydrolase superfamily lysophospholipase
VPLLVEWARERAGRPDLSYALLGHSAGAQFLSRVAAFGQEGATRIVIANPSTWVEPTLEVAAPYGFGGIYGPAQGEAALRRYLALPITVLLGRADTGSYELATSEEAEEQGSNRFERGQKAFRDAEQAAQQGGWAFNWRLAVVPGVGHSARQMFTSDAAFDALQPGADQTPTR